MPSIPEMIYSTNFKMSHEQMVPEGPFADGNVNKTAHDDAFESSSGPIMYDSDNRMPVMMDHSTSLIYLVFGVSVLALLILLPALRRTKLATLISVLAILTSGGCILTALNGTHWLVSRTQLTSTQYKAQAMESMSGELQVNMGLSWTNVSLTGRIETTMAANQHETSQLHKNTINFNERFRFDEPNRLAQDHRQALLRGLPYPILTITEYLSHDSDGFNWARQLRTAGYFTSMCLYAALVAWTCTLIVMCALPKYLPHMLQLTGLLMILAIWNYSHLMSSPSIRISPRVGGQLLVMEFGYNYIMTFAIGAMTMIAGMILFAIHIYNPHEELTVFDSEDYKRDQKTLYNGSVETGRHIWVSTKNYDLSQSQQNQKDSGFIINIESA